MGRENAGEGGRRREVDAVVRWTRSRRRGGVIVAFEDGSWGDGVVGHSTGQLGGVSPWWPRYIGGEHKHLSCIWCYLLFVTTRSSPDQCTALRRNRRKSRAPVPAGNFLNRQAATSLSCQDLDDRSYPPNPPSF